MVRSVSLKFASIGTKDNSIAIGIAIPFAPDEEVDDKAISAPNKILIKMPNKQDSKKEGIANSKPGKKRNTSPLTKHRVPIKKP